MVFQPRPHSKTANKPGNVTMSPSLFFTKAFNFVKWLFVPGQYDDLDPNDIIQRRKRKTRSVILVIVILFIILNVAAILLQDSGIDAPISNDIAVVLVLNLNLILLAVMTVLVIRNLVKLYMERRGKIAGSRFQTKLVIAFLGLTLVPSLLMFLIASELISDTVDKWINAKIEKTLQESLNVAESLYKNSEKETLAYARYLSGIIDARKLTTIQSVDRLNALTAWWINEFGVDIIQVYNKDFELISQARKPDIEKIDFNLQSKQDILSKVAVGESISLVEDMHDLNHVISAVPVPRSMPTGQAIGAIVIIKVVSRELIEKVHSIDSAFQNYKQLSLKKEVIKASYQVTLTLVALVIVFSAIWFGFYLAKGITIPLKILSEATESVAKGDLDVRIDLPIKDDEVGQLVTAFNKMTLDLRTFKEQIEYSNKELSESNIELYHWGQYNEAVLENIGGGVVSVDKTGTITTINNAAAESFSISASDSRGKNYRKVFQSVHLGPIRRVIKEMIDKGAMTIDREINVNVDGKKRTLKTSVSLLTDNKGQYMGMVFVFDNVTDLIAAQRVIAWREMARSIAHEIKNPLTPIQLNTQRLRRKFEIGATDFPKVFDDATNIIIEEVDQLKTLVDKFSRFAKQSEADLAEGKEPDTHALAIHQEPVMLHDIILDVVKLYKDTSQGITLETSLDPSVVLVNIDASQIRSVLINLVENAIDAMDGSGRITISTHLVAEKGMVTLQVADTGHGISDEMKEKIFTPYFSTKKKGTGLGLSIVSRVIEDHDGRIAVRDNDGGGSLFTIELVMN